MRPVWQKAGFGKLQAFLTCWFGLLLLFSLEGKQGMAAHRGLWDHHKRGRGAGGGGRPARLGTHPLRQLIKSRRTIPVRAKAGGAKRRARALRLRVVAFPPQASRAQRRKGGSRPFLSPLETEGATMMVQSEDRRGGELAAVFHSALQPALLLSCALLLYFWERKHSAAPGKRLPGPVGWPLVGNALQLGRLPHLTFCKLAERYGDVFQLRLGLRSIVVLNGEATIRQALVQLGGPFAGRPDFPSFRMVSGGKSVAFGRYTERWRAQRRVAQATLRAFSTANAHSKRLFEQHVTAEAQELIDGLAKLSQGGVYVNPLSLLAVANANVMCALCFGQRYSHTDGEFRALLNRNDRFGQTVAAGSLVDVLPWLLYFPNPVRSVFRDFQAINLEMLEFVRAKVAQHRLTFQPGSSPRHISDAILGLMEHGPGGKEGPLGDYAESTLTDLFGAGQDTTSAALAWLVLLLLKHPQLRKQLQADLDRVVGRDRLPTADDRASLPRLEAFLYETLRYCSLVPVTIPHATTAEVCLGGFHIPEGTVIFVNQWSVNHDRARWKDPHIFDPTRFLDVQQETFDRDLACRVLIFSMGKRRCIGDQLAKLQLFLFMAILLHQCDLTANPAEEIKVDCEHGLVLRPHPYTLSVTRRSTSRAEDDRSQRNTDVTCPS